MPRPLPTSLRPLLEEANKPSPPVKITPEVARCLSLTTSRARDQVDLKLMIGALSEELAQFPFDVVKASLRGWSQREKWWPTLAELREECQWRVDRRRKALEAMRG